MRRRRRKGIPFALIANAALALLLGGAFALDDIVESGSTSSSCSGKARIGASLYWCEGGGIMSMFYVKQHTWTVDCRCRGSHNDGETWFETSLAEKEAARRTSCESAQTAGVRDCESVRSCASAVVSSLHEKCTERVSQRSALPPGGREISSTLVPFANVNDGVCDAARNAGEPTWVVLDEPGTGACAPDGHFLCFNMVGAVDLLPASRVGDGVCDCCDASDEASDEAKWLREQLGRAQCVDECKELFQKEREKRMALRQKIEEGAAIAQVHRKRNEERIRDWKAQKEKLDASFKEASELRKRISDCAKHHGLREQRSVNLAAIRFARVKAKLARAHPGQAPPAVNLHAYSETDAPADTVDTSDFAKPSASAPTDAIVNYTSHALAAVHALRFASKTGDNLTLEQLLEIDELRIKRDATPSHKLPLRHKRKRVLFASLFASKIDARFVIEVASCALFGPLRYAWDFASGAAAKLLGPITSPPLTFAGSFVPKRAASALKNARKVFYTNVLKRTKIAWIASVLWDSGPVMRYYIWPTDDFIAPKLPHVVSLMSASNLLDDAVDTATQKAKEITKLIGIDFGPHQHLHSQCFSHKAGEYVYEFCPFKDVHQNQVNLGTFANWTNGGIGAAPTETRRACDVDASPETCALRYDDMLYADGTKCHNGVVRMTRVTFECGLTDTILALSEVSMCRYLLTFSTPSACIAAAARL